jgi:transcriptional regulator with XRE-family HTH domain
MSVSKRIRQRRKELGLSAEDVAKLIGVSPSTVYRYESSEIENMGIDKLDPIAKALQTTSAYLMGWASAEDNFLQKIGSLSQDMTEEEKRQLLLAARLIIEQRSEK